MYLYGLIMMMECTDVDHLFTRCPLQTNHSDCGLYLLQYVESFFKVCGFFIS